MTQNHYRIRIIRIIYNTIKFICVCIDSDPIKIQTFVIFYIAQLILVSITLLLTLNGMLTNTPTVTSV